MSVGSESARMSSGIMIFLQQATQPVETHVRWTFCPCRRKSN